MRGRYRRLSRGQAQRQMTFSQGDFDGGENSDHPASEIGGKEVALLENAIAFPKYIEGRSGSQRFSDTALPGSGTIRAFRQHATTRRFVLYRGNSVYVGNSAMTSWTQVTLFSAAHQAVTVSGDGGGLITGLELSGCSPSNTNAGTIYIDVGAGPTIDIYSDVARSNRVAFGVRTGTGFTDIVNDGNSGMFGWVTSLVSGTDTDITATVGTGTLSISADTATLQDYENDMLLFTGSSTGNIFFIDLTANKARRFNARPPLKRLIGTGSKGAGTPYGYRYVYTFCRIVDASGNPTYLSDRISGNLVQESPSVQVSGSNVDYGEYWMADPISTTPHTFIPTSSGAIDNGGFIYINDDGTDAEHWTHIGVYRTKDIGANGLDPVTGKGNNPELYAWVGDYFFGTTSITDNVSDETVDSADVVSLQARLSAGFSLKTRFFEALPDGDVGEVTPGFVFSGRHGNQTISYGQTASKENSGYYRSDLQYLKVDDGVQILAKTRDLLSIFCSNKTYISSPNAYFNAGSLEAVFVLNHITISDENVGIIDYGSFAKIDSGNYIAHCSDHTIRIWNSVSWGKDLSSLKVNKIVRQMQIGSTGAYFAGAYFIWYRTDSGQSYNNLCLRFGLSRDNGFGWSRFTGSAWVYPQTYIGPVLIMDANNIQRLLVLDSPDTVFYWIETFTGYTGSGLTKRYLDKMTTAGASGTAIACKVRFREMTGPEESHTCYHEESHAYLRPYSESAGFLSGFQVDILGYVNGAVTATETVTAVPRAGDIDFWHIIQGRRIQLELQIATSGWLLAHFDSHYQAHDKKTVDAAADSTVAATYQAALAGGSTLKHWLTRPNNAMNRATGTDYTATGTAVANSSSPDGNTYGIVFDPDETTKYTQADTTSYSDFTIMFWFNNMDLGDGDNQFINLIGSSSFYIGMASATLLDINGTTVAVADMSTSTWIHFAVVRSGSTITVYQNGVSVGTVALGTARGGTSFAINNGSSVSGHLFDLRVYNTALALAAITYYYNDVNDKDGEKTLPIV